MTYVLLVLGFAAGNFIYQWLGPGNYSIAAERSFFMACAVLWTEIARRSGWL